MKNTEQLVYEMLNPPKKKAAVAVVDSNIHREHILPSEKAFSYKTKMEALKAQGKRTDLTLSQVATKSDTAVEIGKRRVRPFLNYVP